MPVQNYSKVQIYLYLLQSYRLNLHIQFLTLNVCLCLSFGVLSVRSNLKVNKDNPYNCHGSINSRKNCICVYNSTISHKIPFLRRIIFFQYLHSHQSHEIFTHHLTMIHRLCYLFHDTLYHRFNVTFNDILNFNQCVTV